MREGDGWKVGECQDERRRIDHNFFYVTARTNLARRYIVSFTRPLVTPVM